MSKPNLMTINLTVDPDLKKFVLKSCKMYKMTLSQFITYAFKKKYRAENPGVEKQEPYFLYTAKEERAIRRSTKH